MITVGKPNWFTSEATGGPRSTPTASPSSKARPTSPWAIAALVPAVGRTRVAGLPLTLIVLGFAFYPVFLAVGWFYHRQARQLEARFTDLVNPAGHRPDD